MSTNFEDFLRGHLHAAVDDVQVPTVELVRAARQGGARRMRRRWALRMAPAILSAAVIAAFAVIALRSPSPSVISPVADVRPATELAQKLQGALSSTLQQQVLRSSVANKDYADGRYGVLILDSKAGRVLLQVNVARTVPNSSRSERQVPGGSSARIGPDLAGQPLTAVARSTTYFVVVSESWLPRIPGHSVTGLRSGQVAGKGPLPLDQAALQRIANGQGWTVSSR